MASSFSLSLTLSTFDILSFGKINDCPPFSLMKIVVGISHISLSSFVKTLLSLPLSLAKINSLLNSKVAILPSLLVFAQRIKQSSRLHFR